MTASEIRGLRSNALSVALNLGTAEDPLQRALIAAHGKPGLEPVAQLLRSALRKVRAARRLCHNGGETLTKEGV